MANPSLSGTSSNGPLCRSIAPTGWNACSTGVASVVHYSHGAHDDGGDEGDDDVIRNVTGRVDRIDAVTSAVIRTPIDAVGDSIEIAEGQASRHPISRVLRRPPMQDTDAIEFVGYLVALV